MSAFLDRTTLLTMFSALALTLLCLLSPTRDMFPFWPIRMGGHIGDTLFHEMGHTIFSWLYGQPAVPMIFTMFGADQAGGMSMYWQRSWFVQGFSLLALAYGCYWLKENIPGLFMPAAIFTLCMTALAFTPYGKLVISYMGHGGAILTGGFFLFRAWIYLDARNQIERWLNAFFGFFLTVGNFIFAYGLVFDRAKREDYVDHAAFGSVDNDFLAMTYVVHAFSVPGIALFTMALCVVVIIASLVLAIRLGDSFE